MTPQLRITQREMSVEMSVAPGGEGEKVTCSECDEEVLVSDTIAVKKYHNGNAYVRCKRCQNFVARVQRMKQPGQVINWGTKEEMTQFLKTHNQASGSELKTCIQDIATETLSKSAKNRFDQTED